MHFNDYDNNIKNYIFQHLQFFAFIDNHLTLIEPGHPKNPPQPRRPKPGVQQHFGDSPAISHPPSHAEIDQT